MANVRRVVKLCNSENIESWGCKCCHGENFNKHQNRNFWARSFDYRCFEYVGQSLDWNWFSKVWGKLVGSVSIIGRVGFGFLVILIQAVSTPLSTKWCSLIESGAEVDQISTHFKWKISSTTLCFISRFIAKTMTNKNTQN